MYANLLWSNPLLLNLPVLNHSAVNKTKTVLYGLPYFMQTTLFLWRTQPGTLWPKWSNFDRTEGLCIKTFYKNFYTALLQKICNNFKQSTKEGETFRVLVPNNNNSYVFFKCLYAFFVFLSTSRKKCSPLKMLFIDKGTLIWSAIRLKDKMESSTDGLLDINNWQ